MNSERQISIDPKVYPKYKFYLISMVLFWVIWAPATGVVTYLALTTQEIFFYIWLIFGYLGTVLIPWSILSRNRKMTLKLTNDNVEIKGAGVSPNSLIIFPKKKLTELTLEYHDESEPESVYSLNIFYVKNNKRKRIHLVPYITPKSLNEIFNDLCKFLIKNECKFKQKNDYS